MNLDVERYGHSWQQYTRTLPRLCTTGRLRLIFDWPSNLFLPSVVSNRDLGSLISWGVVLFASQSSSADSLFNTTFTWLCVVLFAAQSSSADSLFSTTFTWLSASRIFIFARSKTNSGKQTVHFFAISLWNITPLSIKCSNTLNK